ncbi:MAG: hypothetical protein RJA25_1624 [Bacteroidota bacterium]
MLRIIYLFSFLLIFYNSFSEDSVFVMTDSIFTKNALQNIFLDTIVKTNNSTQRKTLLTRHPPYVESSIEKPILRNQFASFGQKFLRGAGLVFAAQEATVGFTYAMPKHTSNWDKNTSESYWKNYKIAFTQPPIIDKDKWYINYLGHPYQGAYYYNAYRSQGAKTWQSFLFSVAHSTFWEYFIEAGFEQPSIQDLIVTPCVGSLMGELFHFATIRMSKNGFKWYEAAFVSLFNPMFAINNGFKRFNKKTPPIK